MSNTPSKSRFHESVEADVAEYHAIEPMAVLCIILGLFSVMAAFDIIGCFLAVFSVIFGVISLARIKKRPEIFVGRKAALLGLGLAILFASTGMARHLTAEYMIRSQAKTIGQEFLELIASDHPELAFQWVLSPKERCRSAANIWAFYRSNSEAGKKLREFIDKDGIRALLAIGADAKIYPVGQPGYTATSGTESVKQVFAIDFKNDGKEETFFFGLLMRRFQGKTGTPQWMVIDYAGGVDPWETKEKPPLPMKTYGKGFSEENEKS